MKTLAFAFTINLVWLVSAPADLTLVQKIEEGGAQASEMTIKIKGDKSRVDATPELATIYDSKTGDALQLMKEQKAVMHMSAAKMKAAAEMMKAYSGQTQPTTRAKLTPTGKKETINGYEAEEYTAENAAFKTSYWIAPKYPDGAAILKQLQVINSNAWDPGNMGVPNFNDLPGLPIRTVIWMNGTQITSTLVSVKQDPVSETEFTVPKEYKEVQMPDIGSLLQEEGKKPAASASPKKK